MRQLIVTAALIKNSEDGKYLITQRPSDGRSNAGRWEFPGGRLEDDEEDLRSALEREIDEELGISVKAGRVFEVSSHIYQKEDKRVTLVLYECSYVSGEIQKKDIQDFSWVLPSEMKNYDITEADLPFVEMLNSKE